MERPRQRRILTVLMVLSMVIPGAGFLSHTGIAHAATITIDGTHEAAWGLPVATDPQGDMTETNLDVTNLFVTDDANYFYIGFDAWATNWGMNYGIAIDTNGIPGSGATSNPWGRAVTATSAHLPEYYLNVWHPGDGTLQSAQLNHWDGANWSYPNLTDVGGQQAYSQGNHWIEYAVPKSALGNPQHLWLELYTTAGSGHAQDTVPSDPNVSYSAPDWGSSTSILSSFVAYTPTTHISSHDNNVEYDGLGHNSQDSLYRQPFGAVNPGTRITLRFRTFHNDVTGVRVRFYDTTTSREFFQTMHVAASDISCYSAALKDHSCDFWETTVTPTQLSTLYYRFIVTDGTATAYYADDNWKDGAWGQATPNMIDNSYSITVYDPAFKPIPWVKDAVIYQIFPDRFFNGNPANDPLGTEPRYSYPPNPNDQIIKKSWSDLPEGYCNGNSPYVNTPTPCTEHPRGRDYFGGDLIGIEKKLEYLRSTGVTALYLNPIFDSASNHGYDTRDYYQINPFFGSQSDWVRLNHRAEHLGIRIILDGVFNHVSSDSPYFDRYHHFSTVGACESVSSTYRTWFTFHPQVNGPCAGPSGPNTMTYDAWFGFDSLPVLNKNDSGVRNLVYAQRTSVAPLWLKRGASGWRLDVMSDGSFPLDYWQGFRNAVKSSKADAPIICECWKKDEVLPKIHGDTADTTMNYRFRNAILGLFGTVDHKGFQDDGQTNEPPSLFARKMMSMREDYPNATYYTLMNLMDSHDTERILWSMTPGQNNRQDREVNAANVALGKERLNLARIVQFTVPGAPTVYYGDEVGVTGADDPDDRRTFPWNSDGTAGGDHAILASYQHLSEIRATTPALRDGALTFLLTDDANRTLAYAMKVKDQVAIVAINRNETGQQTLDIPLSGYLRDNLAFTDALGGPAAQSQNGRLSVTLPALGAAIFVSNPEQPLAAPSAPSDLTAAGGNHQAALTWSAISGATTYKVYRSPLSGGGYEYAGSSTNPSFLDTAVDNARVYYYVVTAVDAAGNESEWSNEVSTVPFAPIGWAGNLAPASMKFTIDATQTHHASAEVWVDGVTNAPGQGPGVLAQFAFGTAGSDPSTWTWTDMTYSADSGNNDVYSATFNPEQTGTYDYLVRFSTDLGRHWTFANTSAGTRGSMTVDPSSDHTAPAPPSGLHVAFTTAASITLEWNGNSEPDLYRYQVFRSDTSGGPYTWIANVPGGTTRYADDTVTTGSTYYYVIKAQDTSFNVSTASIETSARAVARKVAVTFTVALPINTPPGDTIYIAGDFGDTNGYPKWDPAGIPMTRLDATHASVVLNLLDGTNIQYKYTRGAWSSVEKAADCSELSNRTLSVSFGSTGGQSENDTVAKWADVDHC